MIRSTIASVDVPAGQPAAPPRIFLVWGAGGHGRVVADAVRACGDHVAGFIDRRPERLERVLLQDESMVAIVEGQFLEALRHGDRLPAGCEAIVLGIGDNAGRLRLFEELHDIELPAVIHPSAIVSPSARIGNGTVILAGVVINADTFIGHAVIINTGAVIEHDCVVADGAHVSPGATLTGGVTVAERAWIGAGATAIPNITIGAEAIVGAGATVIGSVPPRTTVVGNPARSVVPR
jgi:UDP-perosamine 4-acetyltransferase